MTVGQKLLIAGAVIGAGLLPILLPRSDASRAWQVRADRDGLRSQVTELTRKLGRDISSWDFVFVSQSSSRAAGAKRRYPHSALLREASSLNLKVVVRNPSRTQYVEAVFGVEGNLTSIRLFPPSEIESRPETWFVRLAGPTESQFRQVTENAQGRDGSRSTWEWADRAQPGVLARIEVLTKDNRLVSAARTTEIDEATLLGDRVIGRQRLALLVTVASVLGFLTMSFAGWAFFQRTTIRKDHLRFPACLIGISVGLLLASYLTGSRIGEQFTDAQNYLTGAVSLQSGSFVSEFLLLMAAYLMIGAGYALLTHRDRPAWIGMKLLAERRFLSRRVAFEILGSSLAGLFTMACLLVVASPWSPSQSPLNLWNPEFLLTKWPAFVAVREFVKIDWLASFAFIWPLLVQFVRWQWARIVILLAAGTVFLALRSPFDYDLGRNLGAGMLCVAIGAWLYRSFGLLSVIFLPLWLALWHQGAVALIQPAAGLATTGGVAVASLAALTGLAGAIAKWGVSQDEAAVISRMEPRAEDLERSERARLNAEFDVARRAQSNMLPANPPDVPGVGLASTCRPARNVGGDLFDFVPLPDGRLAICVADVSGKGVAAALYMTLTKGLLAASTRLESDPRAVLSQLNKHLHATCRNRTFVTMALAAYDHATRRMEYARAGHNPVLWKHSSGEMEFLQPKGLGLGLAKPQWFDRALEVQTLELGPGDILVFYSDGLTEAMNVRSEQFTEERLLKVLDSVNGEDAPAIQQLILAAVDEFTAGAEPHDDLTVLVLRVI